jgi:hypothetical protein
MRKRAPGLSQKTERPAPKRHGPPGGLFGIDQEVVTLRGLYGNSGSRRDLTPGGLNPNSPVSVRTVASSASAPKPRLEQPALSLSHLTWS